MKKKSIEKTIYEFLGVNIFRKYVLWIWEKIAKLVRIDVGYRLDGKTIDSIKSYKSLSKGFAFGH